MNTERTIMVADTKTQKKYKITTNASTLGELKQCLSANNIDYTGMSFTEGITKTTLLDDNSPLPTNIPYKGTTTNNLVLLLTNTRKNIASGMDRKEAYSLIKKYSLQETVKRVHGRNFTQVPTESLEEIIRTSSEYNTGHEASAEQNEPAKQITGSVEEINTNVDMAQVIIDLCIGLTRKGVLSTEDLDVISEAILDYEPAGEIDALMAAM